MAGPDVPSPLPFFCQWSGPAPYAAGAWNLLCQQSSLTLEHAPPGPITGAPSPTFGRSEVARRGRLLQPRPPQWPQWCVRPCCCPAAAAALPPPSGQHWRTLGASHLQPYYWLASLPIPYSPSQAIHLTLPDHSAPCPVTPFLTLIPLSRSPLYRPSLIQALLLPPSPSLALTARRARFRSPRSTG